MRFRSRWTGLATAWIGAASACLHEPPLAPPPSAFVAPNVPEIPAAVARSEHGSDGTRPAPAPANPGSAAPFDSPGPIDVLITGGRIVDGTGARPNVTDLVIDDGRVRHIGPTAPTLVATTRIDARGAIVAPGFIDLHSHADPRAPNANALAMGVTAICIGQDGISPDGVSMREFATRLEGRPLALNVVPFVGHATIRRRLGVGHQRHPTANAIERMRRAVARDLDDGAFGLTTGLEYEPGSYAPQEELIALTRPVAAFDAVVMSHLRSEDDPAVDAALDELLAQAEASGARVHVSHLKVVQGKGVERAERLLAHLDAARRRGVRVTADAYPYEASYTTVGIVFPSFAKPPNDYRRVRATQSADLARHLRARIIDRGGPGAMLFGSGPFAGRTLEQVASSRGEPFERVLAELGPNGGDAAYFVMDRALQERLLVDPHVAVGSDGSATSAHPRGAGTFARVIRRLVVEDGRLSVEEAVRKMSGLAASTLRLDALGRGTLASGHAADVLIFDPERVRDEATYGDPRRLASGMRWVFVNGEPAIAEGRPTNARAGRLLLRGR